MQKKICIKMLLKNNNLDVYPTPTCILNGRPLIHIHLLWTFALLKKLLTLLLFEIAIFGEYRLTGHRWLILNLSKTLQNVWKKYYTTPCTYLDIVLTMPSTSSWVGTFVALAENTRLIGSNSLERDLDR